MLQQCRHHYHPATPDVALRYSLAARPLMSSGARPEKPMTWSNVRPAGLRAGAAEGEEAGAAGSEGSLGMAGAAGLGAEVVEGEEEVVGAGLGGVGSSASSAAMVFFIWGGRRRVGGGRNELEVRIPGVCKRKVGDC